MDADLKDNTERSNSGIHGVFWRSTYLYAAVLLAFLSFGLLGFSFVSIYLKLAVYLVYFIVAALGIIGLYYRRSLPWTLIVLFLIVISPAPQKILTIATILPLSFLGGQRAGHRVVIGSVCSLLIIAGTFGVALSLFLCRNGCVYSTLTATAPDMAHKVEVMNYDAGATGGDTFAELYSLYFGGAVQRHIGNLYHHTWNPDLGVKWLSSTEVVVEESEFDINDFETVYDEGFMDKATVWEPTSLEQVEADAGYTPLIPSYLPHGLRLYDADPPFEFMNGILADYVVSLDSTNWDSEPSVSTFQSEDRPYDPSETCKELDPARDNIRLCGVPEYQFLLVEEIGSWVELKWTNLELDEVVSIAESMEPWPHE